MIKNKLGKEGCPDSLVVAQIDDLEPLHVAHLLGQRLQLVGMEKQHGCILPVAHLCGEQRIHRSHTLPAAAEETGCTRTHEYFKVHTHLMGKLGEEVVICSEGADADTLSHGGGQGFDLIEAAVQLLQRRQAGT